MREGVSEVECCFLCKHYAPQTRKETQGFCREGLGPFDGHRSKNRVVYQFNVCEFFSKNILKKLRIIKYNIEKDI